MMVTMCMYSASGLCNRTRGPDGKGELRQGGPTRMRLISAPFSGLLEGRVLGAGRCRIGAVWGLRLSYTHDDVHVGWEKMVLVGKSSSSVSSDLLSSYSRRRTR